jgi:protein-S-isoprenylcysteine O-methyltransferase Ste14|tara:strand:- start:299 stop:745 length:447 start_codon:yes stop_codon:yes gene_type:complete
MNNKIPPPIVTLAFGLMIYFSRNIFPDINNIIFYVLSLFFIILGPFILISAVRSFKAEQTTINPININNASSLVISGVFKYSRNPMYLGMVFILLALSFRFNLVGGILFTSIFIMYITKFQIIPEEAAMKSIFGEDFNKYKNKTRRWI